MRTIRFFCALILLLTGSFELTYGQTGVTARRVSGRIYFDRNGNGQRDTAEGAFPTPLMLGNLGRPQYQTDTLPTGFYEINLDTTTYDIRVLQTPPHYRLTEGATGHSGFIQAPIQADTGRNFGVAPLAPNLADVRLTLTPHTAARVGRVLRYRARLENVGTQWVPAGQVFVSTDPLMTLLGALPPPTITRPTVQTWNFANLAPMEVRHFEVRVTLPVTTTIGTPLRLFALADIDTTRDLNPADNADSLRQTVVSSFDPNCISVNHTLLSPTQVQAGAPLDYLVQFENLGNDTAFAVTIQDTLPAALMQMGTLQVIATSHNCMWRVTGGGLLSIGFPHIRLPYQGIDALLSSGFVRFRLKPKTTLRIGTLIPNAAHITFDFNAPIATNDVATLVGSPTATPALLAETVGWTLYPNPATSRLTILAETAAAGSATLTLLDGLGRVVRTEEHVVGVGAQQLPVDLQGIPAGLYVVRLTLPGGGTGTRRLVVGGGGEAALCWVCPG